MSHANVPTVDLRGDVTLKGVPFVGPDCRAAAGVAFDHLRQRGLRHFACCGLAGGEDGLMDQRAEAFERLVRTAGHTFSRLKLTPGEANTWESAKPQIAEWLACQPKPVGVLAGNDAIGLQILDACHRAGLSAPEQVAVLGSGNDELVCDLTTPGQSSIDIAGDLVGYEAAALLDGMMRGEGVPERKVLPPRGIVTRGSTDMLAIADDEVAQMLRFIRLQPCAQLCAGDVVRHVGLSRSLLEVRMKRALGRTIDQEIRRVRISRASQLLAETDMPIKLVAHQTGFRTPQYLSRAFRLSTGMTPAGYRRRFAR